MVSLSASALRDLLAEGLRLLGLLRWGLLGLLRRGLLGLLRLKKHGERVSSRELLPS